MKVICWNSSIQIKAENEQDAIYLSTFFEDIENPYALSGNIDNLEIGEFSPEGELEIFGELTLDELKKNHFCQNSWFIQTNDVDKSGQEGNIVGFVFHSMNQWVSSHYKKLLEKELKKYKK